MRLVHSPPPKQGPQGAAAGTGKGSKAQATTKQTQQGAAAKPAGKPGSSSTAAAAGVSTRSRTTSQKPLGPAARRALLAGAQSEQQQQQDERQQQDQQQEHARDPQRASGYPPPPPSPEGEGQGEQLQPQLEEGEVAGAGDGEGEGEGPGAGSAAAPQQLLDDLSSRVQLLLRLSQRLQPSLPPEAQELLAQAYGVASAILGISDTVLKRWAAMQGDQLVLQEEVAALAAEQAELRQQVAKAGSSSSSVSAALLEALTTRLGVVESAAEQLGQDVAAAKSTADAAQACLDQAGLTDAAEAQQLRDAAEKGAAAHMEQGQRKEEVNALRKRVADLEQQQGQLQARVAAAAQTGAAVAWAPVGTSPDEVAEAILSCGTLSKGGILAVTLAFEPRAPAGGGRAGGRGADGAGSPGSRGAGRQRGGSAGAAGGAGSSAAGGAGSSAAAEAAAAAAAAGGAAGGSGGPAAAAGAADSSSGGSAAAAAAAGGSGGRAKQPMALYKLLLRSPELEDTVTGGKTRLALRDQRLPVFVDRVLTAEERAAKRALVPTARKLQVEGKQVRWRGAELQVRVSQPGSRRSAWERVLHQQEPPSPPQRAGAARAAAEAGGVGRDAS